MVLSVLLTGCAKPDLIVYPIRDTDFNVTGEEGDTTIHMSEWYFKNVLKVKLEEGR